MPNAAPTTPMTASPVRAARRRAAARTASRRFSVPDASVAREAAGVGGVFVPVLLVRDDRVPDVVLVAGVDRLRVLVEGVRVGLGPLALAGEVASALLRLHERARALLVGLVRSRARVVPPDLDPVLQDVGR